MKCSKCGDRTMNIWPSSGGVFAKCMNWNCDHIERLDEDAETRKILDDAHKQTKGRELTMSYAEQKPTLNSDIAAFKWQHPHLDSRRERLVYGDETGGIIEARISMEIFSFSAPEIGDVTFDVRGIKDALVSGKLKFVMYETEITPEFAEHVRKNNGVEAERIAALTATDLERPGIMVMWPDGHSTLIDGNNRLVRRFDDGLRTLRFASVNVSLEMLPYLCESGQEEKFLDRETAERGMTSIGRARKVII